MKGIDVSNQYEVTVDQGLGHWFIERFQESLETAGFSQLLRTGDPEQRILEYGRDKVILSVAIHSTRGNLVTIVISSETADLASLVAQAVQEASTDLLTCFIEPLMQLPEGELEARVERAGDAFWSQLFGNRS